VEKERYLRVRFWWAVNDLVRENAKAQIPAEYLEKLHENLARLSDLLDEKKPDERIMKTEIARETGNFAQAMRLIENVPPEYDRVVNPIIVLSKKTEPCGSVVVP